MMTPTEQTPRESGASPEPAARPPAPRPRRPSLFRRMDPYYNDVIVVIIALVTVFAGLVAYLETWADRYYAEHIRQSQALAMEALGQDMRTRQRENYDLSLYTVWNEWEWRRVRAEGRDEAQAARSAQIVDMIFPLTPLLDENQPYYDPETRYSDIYAYHADTNVVPTTLLMEQRAFTVRTANAWDGKADGFITVLTLLAVALFLYGLSTTIKTRLRYLFALVGIILVSLSIVWTVSLLLSPVPEIPLEAIDAYARGEGYYWSGFNDEAMEAYDAALAAFGEYGNAYRGRAEIYLDRGEYVEAAQEYEQAIDYGTDDVGIFWNLGWTYYLAGDYAASLEASRHALERDPELVPVIMNVATALLASGETEAALQEYEAGLDIAAGVDSATPASWSHLYLRLTVDDLDRLINALDGQTDFYQVPDLSNIADPAAVRQAAVTARQRIKEGLVAIESTGSPDPQPTDAQLASLTFAREVSWHGELVGQGDTFSRGVLAVTVELPYENLPQGAILSRRVTHLDLYGVVEHLPTMGQDITWDGPSQGTFLSEMKSPWPGTRGLLPGLYTVEYYVNSKLLQTGSFTIPDESVSIIGPVVLALESTGTGLTYGSANIFPAGVSQIEALFNYSGLAEDTLVTGWWYLDDYLYSWDSLFLGGWGSDLFILDDVPPGDYRLDIYLGDEEYPRQSAQFQVVDVDAYLQAIDSSPQDALFHRSLGDAFAYKGEYERAGDHYNRAIEIDPGCVQCYYHWWSALYDHGDYTQAIDKLRAAIELDPTRFGYLTDLGLTYYQAGDDEGAQDAYREAIPSAPAYVYNAWGNALYGLERYDDSAIKYWQAIELEPDNAVYYTNLAGSYRELGEYDLAEAGYEEAVSIDPSYAYAYNQWGNLLYDQERYEEAADKYLEAIDLQPGNAVYYANLGDAYRNLGWYDLAAVEYERAVETDPWYDYAYNQWGNTFYSQGYYAEATEKYEMAISLNPYVVVYHTNLGGAYYEMGEYALAAAAYEQATLLDPEDDWTYNRWGNALYSQGYYAEATEKYELAIYLDPTVVVYHTNLAGAYYEMEEYALAAAAYEQAALLDPEDDWIYNRWGNALYAQGYYSEAADKYISAIWLAPDEAVYHYNLGWCYYQLYENDLAIIEFELARDLAELAGDESLRQSAQDMLDQLQP